MSSKNKHQKYIKENGEFVIKCNTSIFTNEEIKILKKYALWFEALTNGTLIPFSEKQKRFITSTKKEIEPFSIEEKACDRYSGRRQL